MSKKHQDTGQGVESVDSMLSRSEQYIEDNQKSLSIIVGAIALIVAAYLGYKKFYLAPLEQEATSQMFGAEQYFEKDSFNLALYGDGNYIGFLDVIDEYGLTKSGNLSHYYAGISYLQIGEYKQAIDHLKRFDADDIIISTIALGAIGDAYTELNDYDKAIQFYEKAAEKNPNNFSTPIYLKKLGLVYEETGNFEKALEVYEKIESEYPNSEEGRSVAQDITKVKHKLQ
ncbi:MAG: tetratricopeptide repeat protein [Bacteroidetes bacterium]|jgi:tetratricopeptide (TPR) repeat protein|nr:tetratricopeptide repeat protein [Bacteroidota bacterium]